MKLYGSTTSPFVRIVRIAAIELGLGDRLELVPTVVKPTQANRDYAATVNPIRRVPALETDAGAIIVDSRVIAEHLDLEAGTGKLTPPEPRARVACLNRHAVLTGGIEALVLAMYETKLRPDALRWDAWVDDQIDKAHAALDWAEARADAFDGFRLDTIALVAFLGYARFRFAEIDWAASRARIAALDEAAAARASVALTIPQE